MTDTYNIWDREGLWLLSYDAVAMGFSENARIQRSVMYLTPIFEIIDLLEEESYDRF